MYHTRDFTNGSNHKAIARTGLQSQAVRGTAQISQAKFNAPPKGPSFGGASHLVQRIVTPELKDTERN